MGAKIYQHSVQATEAAMLAMQTYHPDLFAAGVTVKCTMVAKLGTEEQLIPCLKLHGALATAVIRLVRGSERVYVDHLAEILIDQCQWEDFAEPERTALLDHELNHLVLVKTKQGITAVDDAGRPKLRMRPDDWCLTGFLAIARRHGNHAVEVDAITRVAAAVREALQPVPPTPTAADVPASASQS